MKIKASIINGSSTNDYQSLEMNKSKFISIN